MRGNFEGSLRHVRRDCVEVAVAVSDVARSQLQDRVEKHACQLFSARCEADDESSKKLSE